MAAYTKTCDGSGSGSPTTEATTPAPTQPPTSAPSNPLLTTAAPPAGGVGVGAGTGPKACTPPADASRGRCETCFHSTQCDQAQNFYCCPFLRRCVNASNMPCYGSGNAVCNPRCQSSTCDPTEGCLDCQGCQHVGLGKTYGWLEWANLEGSSDGMPFAKTCDDGGGDGWGSGGCGACSTVSILCRICALNFHCTICMPVVGCVYWPSNPCFAIASWQAIQSTQATTSICLKCPEGEVIADILSAQFGTLAGNCGSGMTPAGTCAADTATVLATVKEMCVGKAKCSVDATSSLFGSDPCPGTLKHLTATAQCRSKCTDSTAPVPGARGSICSMPPAAGSNTNQCSCSEYAKYFSASSCSNRGDHCPESCGFCMAGGAGNGYGTPNCGECSKATQTKTSQTSMCLKCKGGVIGKLIDAKFGVLEGECGMGTGTPFWPPLPTMFRISFSRVPCTS